jgi:hypothetical protein
MDTLSHIDDLLKDELSYIEQVINIQPRETQAAAWSDYHSIWSNKAPDS